MADSERSPRPLLRTLVGEVLRRHRHRQQRTLAAVARAANISVQYLSEVERARKEPSSEVLAAVCAALGIDLSDLLAEVRHDLLASRVPVGRAPAAVLRLSDAQLRRQSRSTPQLRISGPVLLAA